MWGHFTDCGFDRCGVPLKNYLGRLSECTPCCKLHQMEELCNTATSNLAKKSCSGSLVFVRKVLSNWKLKTCWCLWQVFLTVLESSWTQERAGSSVKLQPAAFFSRSLVPDNGEEQTFCYYFLLFYISHQCTKYRQGMEGKYTSGQFQLWSGFSLTLPMPTSFVT